MSVFDQISSVEGMRIRGGLLRSEKLNRFVIKFFTEIFSEVLIAINAILFVLSEAYAE